MRRPTSQPFNTALLRRAEAERVDNATPSLTGQDLQAIIEDLCAIVREWHSDSRHAPRAISAACISAIEQLCRHLIALQLSRDDSTMPQTLTIDVVSLARAAGMPPAVLVSFTYNFQSVAVIIEALRAHGIADPFRGDEGLKRYCPFGLAERPAGIGRMHAGMRRGARAAGA